MGVPIGGVGSAGALSGAAGIPSVGLGSAGAAGGAGAGGAASTGAAKLGTLGKLGAAGQVLSGYSQGAAQGREHEAMLNLTADQLRQRQVEDERQNAINRGTLEVTQKKTGQDLETQARQQAAWGQFMQHPENPFTLPDSVKAKFGPGPDYSGFKPIGDEAYRAAQQRLLSGSDKQFTPQPNIPSPPLTPQPNESTLEKLMRYAGLVSGTAGALGGYKPPVR